MDGRRWRAPAMIAVVGLVTAAIFMASGDVGFGVIWAIVAAWAAWAVSPLRGGRHLSHAAAVADAAGDALIVYWKPGCSVCMVIDSRLRRDERARLMYVDVTLDEDAAALVRSLQDGDLLTPTAVTGAGDLVRGDGVRHATLAAIRGHLAAAAS